MKRRFVVDKDKVRYKAVTKFNKRRVDLKVDGFSKTLIPIEKSGLWTGDHIEFVDNQGNIYKCNIRHLFECGLSGSYSNHFKELLGRYDYVKKEEKFSLKKYFKKFI